MQEKMGIQKNKKKEAAQSENAAQVMNLVKVSRSGSRHMAARSADQSEISVGREVWKRINWPASKNKVWKR